MRIASCLILGIALVACSSDGDEGSLDGVSRSSLLPLHAQRGTDPGIYDADGRRVLLRGVNYTALGDYYQENPEYPAAIAPKAEDAPDMAALGFNVVRLILHWSALEPVRGEYDEDYLDRVAEQVRRFAALGMYVVLDMHQDAWGKYVATREAGDICVPPLEPAIGWDGAPEWATYTDGLTTCRAVEREVSPAVTQAFTSFYLNRDGIQDAFIATWQHVVARFAAEPAVAGYDLLNEPHPSYAIGVSGATLLPALHARTIDAIRETEQAIPGGFAHIAFFEPTILWSTLGSDVLPLPTFTDDTNLVFAPHLYCEVFTPTSLESCFTAANGAEDYLGTTVWVGEWAGWSEADDMVEHRRRYAALEDANLYGGAAWQWTQGCWEPHTLGTPGNTAPEQTVHVARTGCPDNDYLGVVEINRPIYSRPYPRAAPGLASLSSDPDTNSAVITGSDAGTAELWVADQGDGEPSIGGDQVEAVRLTRVPGGYRVAVDVGADWRIEVNDPVSP